VQDFQDALVDPEFRTTLVGMVLGFGLSVVLGVVVHEAGHVLCGRLAGYRIRLVRIGCGPTLLRLRLRFGLLIVNAFPISGAVHVYRPLVTERHARVFLIAGGCVANTVAAAILMPIVGWPPDPVENPVLASVTIVQALAIFNLLVVIGPGRRGTTDGGLLRDALRRPARAPDRLLERLYAQDVAGRYASLPAALPSRLAAVVLHATLIGTPAATYAELSGMDSPHAPEDRACLRRRLLTRAELTLSERATLVSALLTDALLGLTKATGDELDKWSTRLVEFAPEEPLTRVMRGTALLLVGQPQGRAMLEANLDADPSPFARVLSRIFLAKELLRQGHRDEAASTLAAARAHLAGVPDDDRDPVLAVLLETLASEIAVLPSETP
jgi:hypothetical protein